MTALPEIESVFQIAGVIGMVPITAAIILKIQSAMIFLASIGFLVVMLLMLISYLGGIYVATNRIKE